MSAKSEIVREMARRLRPCQLGEEWQAIQDTVAALVDILIRARGMHDTLTEGCEGRGSIQCVPVDKWAAVVHIDTAVYFVESAEPWTSSAGGGWSRPVRPSIVLIAMNGPELRDCPNAPLQ